MKWFAGFNSIDIQVNGVQIHARVPAEGIGNRQPLLLLHGYPQSHVLWHKVAQALRHDYFLVIPDLRGYGNSSKPAGLPDHSNYSKRVMAQDMVALMDFLGIEIFHLCGHDRGGRVAHRLALDHPGRVRQLCLIDIVPTLDTYAATDFEFAKAYYHWFYLIQPAPLPEAMIGGAPTAYLHAMLGGLGSGGIDYLEPQALAEYEQHIRDPQTVHGMCEDYRASASIDLEHDRDGRSRNDLIKCPTLILVGERGVTYRLFDVADLWAAQCALPVTVKNLPCGHFVPEQLAEETSGCLRNFYG